MRQKITAILAADIAGYSRLVAEDEEETLRRLATCRAVFEDFVARGFGRIFNTAGDAVLAEFPSTVEAVRCAIDVQESLRTRNLSYPPSRQMSFRIGITVGDVVERDGDLLGDGVNIAARLQALAQPGGLCVSRTVYEQVANKLSVAFVDIGEQFVKNIPSPVHVYTLALGRDDAAAQSRPGGEESVKQRFSLRPLGIGLAGIGVIGVAVLAYAAVLQGRWPSTMAAAPTMPPKAQAQVEALVPELVPMVADRERAAVRDEYLPAPDHKALAISDVRMAFITGQKDDEAAKTAALHSCQEVSDALGPGHRCEIYAIGDAVVYAQGHPPMPPEPWLIHDPSIERPFSASDVPLVSDADRQGIAAGREGNDRGYSTARKSKALAISSQGARAYFFAEPSPEEAARRALEKCGFRAGAPCLIIAVDDSFIVPIPTTMKVVGFFKADRNDIAPEIREDVAQRLRSATSGWNAIAVGFSGQPGLGLKQANEQDATAAALTGCMRQDRNCRVIGIGPFSVESK
jgi:class 3 adenylate cyclase